MRLTRWEPFREMDELLKGFTPFLGRMPMTRPVEASRSSCRSPTSSSATRST